MYGSRPLSKLESALYVIVACVLGLVALDRMLAYFEYAERAAVETTLLNTQSALHTRLAYDLMRGEATDLAAWAARNPFELARMGPQNTRRDHDLMRGKSPDPARSPYEQVQKGLQNLEAGRDASDQTPLQRGNWTYEPVTRDLVYRPRYSRGLAIHGGGTELRFRLTIDSPRGVPRLMPVSPYRWEP